MHVKSFENRKEKGLEFIVMCLKWLPFDKNRYIILKTLCFMRSCFLLSFSQKIHAPHLQNNTELENVKL